METAEQVQADPLVAWYRERLAHQAFGVDGKP